MRRWVHQSKTLGSSLLENQSEGLTLRDQSERILYFLKQNWSDFVIKWSNWSDFVNYPLIIVSGRFRNAQLRWAIPDKEGYVYGEQLHEYAHWVNGGCYASAIFTDHHNLLAFFDNEVRPSTCTKPNRQRLTRWGLNLRSLWYEIHPISGEENRVADIGSRWGNRFAGGVELGCATRGPKAVTKAWLPKGCCNQARMKRVLRMPEPKTHSDPKKPDINARADLVLDMDTK